MCRQCRLAASRWPRAEMAGRSHDSARRGDYQGDRSRILPRRVAAPVGTSLQFQSLGAVMEMDCLSSGITTSVIGALKRGLTSLSGELGPSDKERRSYISVYSNHFFIALCELTCARSWRPTRVARRFATAPRIPPNWFRKCEPLWPCATRLNRRRFSGNSTLRRGTAGRGYVRPSAGARRGSGDDTRPLAGRSISTMTSQSKSRTHLSRHQPRRRHSVSQ